MDRNKYGSSSKFHRHDNDRTSSRDKYKSDRINERAESSRRRSPSPSNSSPEERSRPKTKSSHRRKSPDTKKKRKDKKKHKHRSKSSSSDSSESSQGSVKLLQKLKDERVRQAEHRVQQKEVMKASETPEEKRLRRLLKKEAKERKRKERMGWDNDYLHYTNADNPFGDGNLLATFVWSKKLDKEGLTGVSREELDVRNRQKQEENKRELEKVKKRRQERELERQQREEEMSLMQRSKEAAQFQEWERQEDQFHLEQSRLRSCIRIQEGRAKPIDLLAKYVSAEGEVDAVEMHEPYTYLNGLAVKDLEDLIEDIKVYKELERGKNLGYWHDITVIVQDELHKLRKLERRSEYEAAVGRREGIHQAVAKDVASIFRGKTAAQLETLQAKIEAKIVAKAEGVDIGYWESLLSQLKAHMARARLRDRHQENLLNKLQLLKAQQGVAADTAVNTVNAVNADEDEDEDEEPAKVDVKQEAGGSAEGASTSAAAKLEQEDDDDQDKAVDAAASSSDSDDDSGGGGAGEDAAEALIAASLAEFDAGGYEPALLTPAQLEPGTLVVAEDDDLKRLAFARLRITGPGVNAENVMGSEEQSLLREARKGMAGDEVEFSVETTLDSQVYLWSDKYRPRKPRYFNRVHTGFEWNKYNQTHYDMDNPPPKIVQGYKFNIFYPDLIDKQTTPEYFLTACEDNRDFANLRFHAGPPYEDIAFKIVNREWEYSYKRGFRCQFHNNIFQLWFHFKRYRYRR